MVRIPRDSATTKDWCWDEEQETRAHDGLYCTPRLLKRSPWYSYWTQLHIIYIIIVTRQQVLNHRYKSIIIILIVVHYNICTTIKFKSPPRTLLEVQRDINPETLLWRISLVPLSERRFDYTQRSREEVEPQDLVDTNRTVRPGHGRRSLDSRFVSKGS